MISTLNISYDAFHEGSKAGAEAAIKSTHAPDIGVDVPEVNICDKPKKRARTAKNFGDEYVDDAETEGILLFQKTFSC